MPWLNRIQTPLSKDKGFTLVELMVAIAVIGILASIAIFNIPNIQKSARDSQRVAELRQLQTVLERYKVDQENYPLSDDAFQIKDHPWGSRWQEYNYIVPKDPLPSQKYIYVSDGQSYQIYVQFENISNAKVFACSAICGPDGGYNGGVAGGVSSSLISWSSTSGSTNPSGGGVSAGGGVATESAKPFTPLIAGQTTYTVSGGGSPFTSAVDFSEIDPTVGSTQTIQAHLNASTSITSVTAVLRTDNGVRSFPLNRASGTDLNGVWNGSWVVADTHNSTYVLSIRATDSGGESSSIDIVIR